LVGDGPYALVWNSTNNTVLCANSDNTDVTVIDGATNQVITTVPVGGGPNTLIWNSTNNKVYCANGNSDNVTIINGANNQVVTTIAVGNMPFAFAWNSIQNRTYAANFFDSTVSVIMDVTGIEESSMLDAISVTPEIYPNPAKGVLRVRGPLSEKAIKIFDVSGKMVKEIEILRSTQNDKGRMDQNDGASEAKISLKGINPGIYFLQFGEMSVTKK